MHTLQFKNEPLHITLSLREEGRLGSSKILQELSILFPLKNGYLPTNGEPRDLWLHLKLLQPKFKNHWPPGRSPSLLLWPPHYGRGHLPSKFSVMSQRETAAVHCPAILLSGACFSDFFLEDQSCNHPLCESGVWLCPLATTGHFRTHCRKSSIQASVSGQGFCSSADSMGVLPSSTKYETSTCVQCLLNRGGKPQQCTMHNRDKRKVTGKKGKGK